MATVQPQSFAHVLRRARLAAGLTQEALAERAGLAARSISDLERGVRRAPYKATVILLAEALHLSEAERAAFEVAAYGLPSPAVHLKSAQGAPVPTSAQPPFVGREHEVERLARHLAGVSGTPLLVLAGEPGIGKSRLLRETVAHAEAVGWAVVEGGCTRRSGQELYAPLVGALAQYVARLPLAQLRADLQGCAWLVRLLPELAERAVVPLPEWTLAPEQERRLMFAAVSRFLSNSAGPAGTLLVLDDLQWAGLDALDLLESLARVKPEQPLRVLGAYRSTEVYAGDPLTLLLVDLAREELAAELAIGPLDDMAATELVERLLPSEADNGGERGDVASRRLVARAGGVPFFLMSGARALASGVATDVPWDVSQSIRQRVSALSAETQELLGMAAVAGRMVPSALFLALAREPERETLAALKAACQAKVLTEVSRAEYAFVHDLVREAVEADLTQGQRAIWHRHIAEWMEGLPERERDRHTAAIAQHFAESDQPGRAVPYALAAGDRAEAAYAHAEAEGHYRMALALVQEQGDRAREAATLEGLHVALTNQAHFDEAQEAADRAAALYQALGDEEGVLRALWRFGEMHVVRGRPHAGLARMEPLLNQLEASAPSPGLSRYLATTSHLYHQAGRPDEALATAKRAIVVARSIEYAAGLAHGQHVLINALSGLGRTAELEQALEQIVPLCEAAGDLLHLALGLGNIGAYSAAYGDCNGARKPLDRAVQVAEQLGEALCLGTVVARRSELSFWLGEWDHATADANWALEIFRRIAPSVSGYIAPAFCGRLLYAQGQRQLAQSYFEESLTMTGNRFRNRLTRFARGLEAEDTLVRGLAEAARDLLEPLFDPAASESDAAMLAWAYADLGQPDRAAAVLESYVTRAVAQGNVMDQVEVQRVQAILALRQHHWQESAAILEDSIARCQKMPYPYAEAKALWVYGQLEMARSQPARARERYEQALAIFNRLGERLYAEHVERALADLKGELH